MRTDERADLDIVPHVAADQRREGIRPLRASRHIRRNQRWGKLVGICRGLLWLMGSFSLGCTFNCGSSLSMEENAKARSVCLSRLPDLTRNCTGSLR